MLTSLSLSARRAWIEISFCRYPDRCVVSLSARRAWIEMSIEEVSKYVVKESLSARRAWIEMPKL